MPRIKRQPVRPPAQTIPLQGQPDKAAVVVKRRRRVDSGGQPKRPAEGQPGPPTAKAQPPAENPCPEPLPRRNVGGRPKTLEEASKVLVTLEACDLQALEGWRKRRGYPHRSAAVRAMIAEVCGHG